MPQIINTNISSINAQRNLNKSQGSLQTSLQRLSSGLRINSAKDDAAGLAISNRFMTQVRGMNVAVRNANDGVSLAQTTESALDEITTSLQRIRDLAVQSANSTNSQADRLSLQAEVDQLIDEIERIATTTTFNGQHVLDGTLKSYYFQIGANANEGVDVDGVDARINSLGSQPGVVQSTASSLSATASLATTDFYIKVGGAATVDVATLTSGGPLLGHSISVLTDPSNDSYGAGKAKSLAERINELRQKDIDGMQGVYATAKTTYDYLDTAASATPADAFVGVGSLANGDLNINGVDIGPVTFLEKDADGSLLAAINAKSTITGVVGRMDDNGRLVLEANDGRDMVVTTQNGAADLIFNGGGAAGTVADFTDDFKTGTLTISAQDTIILAAYQTATDDVNTQAVGTIANADITTLDGCNITMQSVDSALAQVDGFRGELGAVQNRFESTIRNLSAVSESLSAANSRIRDADFAAETANLSKNQVLQQAGISVLAQANALPQQVLSLLQG